MGQQQKRTVWENLYSHTWQNILPEGNHPAKFRPGLIERIYRYVRYEAGLPIGARILDPFAGIAGGALYALLFGYRWTGFEIEKHFYADGRKNIQTWMLDYVMALRSTSEANIYLKDSAIGPYKIPAQSVLISSPPFGAGETRNRTSYQDGEISSMMSRAYTMDNQGQNPDNLALMTEDPAVFNAIISSPPYEDVIGKGDGPGARWDNKYHSQETMNDISTRPDYGQSSRQMGKTAGRDFWTMANQVVINCHKALEPGALVVWVCKDYVRNGERVNFSDKWEQLCQTRGYETIERIEASVVTDNGTQLSLFDDVDDRENRKEYKSMFRRLAEAKGSPRIDHEDVIVMTRV